MGLAKDLETRAVKLSEKLNSNLKGINSVREKKKLLASLLRPQEGALS